MIREKTGQYFLDTSQKMPYGRSYGRRSRSNIAGRALARRAYARGFFSSGPKGDPNTFTFQTFGKDYKSATPAQRLLRRAVPYKGKGAYWGQALGRWAGGRLAAATGISQLGDWGAKAGDWASDKAQDFAMGKIRKLTGQGMYGGQGGYINNSLIMGGQQSLDVAGNSDETETITLRNYESIMDIYAPEIALNATSPYSSQKIDVNPGLYSFSRKLQSIAKNYVQYEIKQLVFELRPLISESSVNNGLTGSIMMGVLYDALAEAPDNKDDFMDFSGAVSGKIHDNLNVGVECDPNKTKDTEYLVRTGPVPLNRDVDEYDHCALMIATNNIPDDFSNQAIAELYVYYTIELRMWKPNRDMQKELVVCSAPDTAHTNSPLAQFTAKTPIAYAQQNNIGCKYSSPAAGRYTVTFPANYSGCVELHVQVEGTSLVTDTSTVSVSKTGNCDPLTNMFASAQSGDADSPHFYSFISNPANLMLRTRFRIRSATGNTDNSITMILGTPTSGTVTQFSVEVTEFSPQNFTKGTSNPVPVFVDHKGMQVSA